MFSSRPVDIAANAALSGDALSVRATLTEQGKTVGRLQALVDGLPAGFDTFDRLRRGRLSGSARFNGPLDALWRLSGVEQHPDHARLLDGSHGDPRIAAAVLLDTGLARGFTATSLAALQTPVLIVAAGQPDPVQPQEKESRVAFERLPPSTTEYRLHAGASHFSYLGSCRPDATALLAQGAPEERLVCLDGPGQDRTSLHRQTVEDVGGFLTRHLAVR